MKGGADTDRAVAIDARVAVTVPACGDRCLLRDWLRLLPVVAVAAQTPTARGGQAEQTEGKRSEALEARSAERAVGRSSSTACGRRPDAGASAPMENSKHKQAECRDDIQQRRHRVGVRLERGIELECAWSAARRDSTRAGGKWRESVLFIGTPSVTLALGAFTERRATSKNARKTYNDPVVEWRHRVKERRARRRAAPKHFRRPPATHRLKHGRERKGWKI